MTLDLQSEPTFGNLHRLLADVFGIMDHARDGIKVAKAIGDEPLRKELDALLSGASGLLNAICDGKHENLLRKALERKGAPVIERRARSSATSR